jgi:hypothetical protein
METLIDSIRDSQYLSSQHIQLLQAAGMPVIDPSFGDEIVKSIVEYYSLNPYEMDIELHKYAARLLTQGRVAEAWQVLLTTAAV